MKGANPRRLMTMSRKTTKKIKAYRVKEMTNEIHSAWNNKINYHKLSLPTDAKSKANASTAQFSFSQEIMKRGSKFY